MPDNVFINGRAAVHSGSAGKSIAFPDVCLCPPSPPAGPIPTPLPNNTQAADVDGCADTVFVNGNPMGHRLSFIAKSTGNEVAQSTGGGVITHTVQGKAFYQSYAMNVLVEGNEAVRHLDLLTQNHMAKSPGNTPPAPWLSTMTAPAAPPPQLTSETLHSGPDWIGLCFVDQDGSLLAYAKGQIEFADGAVRSFRVLVGAEIVYRGVKKGNCTVTISDFGDKERRRRKPEPRDVAAPKRDPAGQETKAKRADLSGKGVALHTGKSHRLVVQSPPATIKLVLQSADRIRIPEARFAVTFADGSRKEGRLDHQGERQIPNAPPGAYSVEYPDDDDIRAKVFAGRAATAMKKKDLRIMAGVLAQSKTLVQAAAQAYQTYFSPSGSPLHEDALALAKGRPEEVAIKHLIACAEIGPPSGATLVAWQEPDTSGGCPPNNSGAVLV